MEAYRQTAVSRLQVSKELRLSGQWVWDLAMDNEPLSTIYRLRQIVGLLSYDFLLITPQQGTILQYCV